MGKHPWFLVTTSRVIQAPLSFVYAWWTDFREDDPQITGQKRTILTLERTDHRFIMSVRYESFGRERTAARIISLKPPDGWHLDWIGDEHDETGDYSLTKVSSGKTRVSVVFKVTNKTSAAAKKSEFLKNVIAIWDKYVAALESDYHNQATEG